ncbi:MAG: Fe(2+)-trafficking protein [Phycisphaerales bacterium]|jgi:Fe-S cluster biosynthesis and repair protein YggX|nr:Fe(2+)-trafficking protein [Phycisphaerales bacterium]
MNDLSEKIERFENMAMADPSNDMAHFSLGSAYLDAKRFAEATKSFESCIKLNPDMTRAMELRGSALLQLGEIEEAKKILIRGYEQSASKGEIRVRDGIAEILKAAGLETPSVEQSIVTESGKPLEEAPLPGEIGKWILENVDDEQWNVWIGQGTKVINELRLDFSRDEDQIVYEEYMAEFLGIPTEVINKDKKAANNDDV